MKIFWKAPILEMAGSDIFCATLAFDDDAAIQNMMRLFFAEILALPCPKNALQNAPEKVVVNAIFGKPLRANRHCDVAETPLK